MGFNGDLIGFNDLMGFNGDFMVIL